MRELKVFQIFRAGSHVARNGNKVSITVDDLKRTASAYSPTRWKAPLTLGHPVDNEPAYGHVQELYVEGDGLYAKAEVDAALVEHVRAGRYTNRSAAFYPENAKNNPMAGVLYLRHVGFLGAHPPSVKGMPPLDFTETSPLLADIALRHYCYGEAEPIRPSNPLVADAEERLIQRHAYSTF